MTIKELNKTREYARKYDKQWRDAYRKMVHRLKNKPCVDCNERFKPWQMQFDHREPREKLFGIAGGHHLPKWAIIKEIAKCDIVCANCHADRTYQRKNEIVQRVETRLRVDAWQTVRLNLLIGTDTMSSEPVWDKERNIL
jgi:hypothetical protein